MLFHTPVNFYAHLDAHAPCFEDHWFNRPHAEPENLFYLNMLLFGT